MADTIKAVPSPGPSRIKRNSACTSCRDAKVRCNPSLNPNQSCLRCGKLSLECVVDKTHKRVSRKSKLDELVQEIQTIKRSVGNNTSPSRLPITPAVGLPEPPQVPAFREHMVLSNVGLPSPVVSRDALSISASTASHTPATTLVTDSNIETSLPRALGSQPFSGADIDYYFQKYFEHYHPYLPIIRHRDPNKCYESGSVLFWTIILIACGRYARDAQVMSFLVDAVKKELFATITNLPLTMPSINALILVCAWAFPDTRFINDPTSMFSGAAMNASLLLGIHTGKGHIPEFSFGMFQNNFSDEEAVYTWAGYNIVAQRVSAYMGLPPLGPLMNQTVQNVIDGKTPFQVPSSFRVLLECQKFANRLSKTMSAYLDESRGVSPHVVRHLEEEFDATKGLICSERADDLDRFNALVIQLEIQTYYLLPLPGYDPEPLKRNVLRAYITAQTVIRDVFELDRKMRFLHHIPHWYFRSILSATCIVFKVLRSSYRDFINIKQAEKSAADAIAVFRRASIMDGDLPTRLANLVESIWSAKNSIWHDEPVSAFSHRLGASVHFDCLKRWKNDMNEARPQAKSPATGGSGETPVLTAPADPLSNIDWSFMDDFDWNFEPGLLVPVT